MCPSAFASDSTSAISVLIKCKDGRDTSVVCPDDSGHTAALDRQYHPRFLREDFWSGCSGCDGTSRKGNGQRLRNGEAHNRPISAVES